MMFLEKRYNIDIRIILGIVALVLLVCLLWYISVYNDLKRASIKVDESDSAIDVTLTKRYDVLTKMIKVFSKNIVAKMNNMVRRDFFEADELKKKDMKIKM